MKLLSFLSLFLFTAAAFAESAGLIVGAFSGELITPQNVTIQNINVEAHIQHCNFWGASCSDGPGETKSRKTFFKLNQETHLLEVKSPSHFEVYTNIPGNKFMFCAVSLIVTGLTSNNRSVEGYVNLVYEEDKNICASSSHLNKMIQEKFTSPQLIDFWNL